MSNACVAKCRAMYEPESGTAGQSRGHSRGAVLCNCAQWRLQGQRPPHDPMWARPGRKQTQSGALVPKQAVTAHPMPHSSISLPVL